MACRGPSLWFGLLLLSLAANQLHILSASGTHGVVLPKYTVPASGSIPTEPKLHRSNRTLPAGSEVNVDLEVCWIWWCGCSLVEGRGLA